MEQATEYPTEAGEPRDQLDELAALVDVSRTIDALEPDARARVLRYANDRFGVKREPRAGGRRSR